MVLVLDANEYIFAFGRIKDPNCERLIHVLRGKTNSNRLRITRLIVDEVRRNVSLEDFRKFIVFLNKRTTIDEDMFVPFELGEKYRARGLKPADAFIGAYADWVKTDILVTENRHFLTRQKNLPFKVRTAEQALRLIK